MDLTFGFFKRLSWCRGRERSTGKQSFPRPPQLWEAEGRRHQLTDVPGIRCLGFCTRGGGGGVVRAQSFSPGNEPSWHSSSSAQRTKLQFGLFCNIVIFAPVPGLHGWATQLPLAFVFEGRRDNCHLSPGDYLRLRIQDKGLAASGNRVVCRDPSRGPLPPTDCFLVCE